MQRSAGSPGTEFAGSAAAASASAAAAAGGSGSFQLGVPRVGEYDMMSEDEQPRDTAADIALKGAVKRTRVEGR